MGFDRSKKRPRALERPQHSPRRCAGTCGPSSLTRGFFCVCCVSVTLTTIILLLIPYMYLHIYIYIYIHNSMYHCPWTCSGLPGSRAQDSPQPPRPPPGILLPPPASTRAPPPLPGSPSSPWQGSGSLGWYRWPGSWDFHEVWLQSLFGGTSVGSEELP